MPPVIPCSLCIVLAALLASCALPGKRSSSGRDVLGHRPGPQGFRTVIIDAGHGGKDSGATSRSSGAREKDLALDLAKRLQSELRSHFKTIMMRDDDSFVDLDERVIRANRHGIATRLQAAMTTVSPFESANRGLVRRRLRLTRNPEIPCVLLECGYLSHPEESHLIVNPAYRQQLASSIAGAIRTQASMGDAGTGPLPPPINAPPSRPDDARE